MQSLPPDDTSQRVFAWGTVALGFASLLLPIGLSYPTAFDPRVATRNAAWEYLSDHFVYANMLLVIALALLMFGIFTLQHYLISRGVIATGSILVGTSLTFIGIAFLLPVVGIRAFALPDYAQTYVLTNQAALSRFNLASFGGNVFFFGGLGGIALVVGSSLLMRGVQACSIFPKWTIVAYDVGMLFAVLLGDLPFSSPIPGYDRIAQLLRVTGGLLIASAGVTFAWRMRRTGYPASATRPQLG